MISIHTHTHTHLVLPQRINPQNIKNVPLATLPLPPLGRLHRAQIVRRVHVADLPVRQPRHLALQVPRPVLLGEVVEGGAPGVVVPDRVVAGAVDVAHHSDGVGDVGVAVRGAGVVAGDVGGEGGVLGTLGEGVVGGWGGGGEGAVGAARPCDFGRRPGKALCIHPCLYQGVLFWEKRRSQNHVHLCRIYPRD